MGFANFPPQLTPLLLDLHEERIKNMDAGRLSLQVISHGPTDGSAPLDICRGANNELKAAINAHSTRYAGLAMIPMIEPAAAAEELARCIKQLGFKGVMVNNHEKGRFYDDPFFWPVFEQCQNLDVPFYFHPTVPAPEMTHKAGNYPDVVKVGLDQYCWGWHSETGKVVLRLYASGLFDKYPKLKIILGHMGEMIPFMLDRTIKFATKQWPERQRDLRTVWKENLYITTAGMFTLAPLACLLKVSSIDHIMYSVDYPFEKNEDGLAFMEELEQSGMCSKEGLDKIAFGNAEKLLGVKATH